MASAVGAEGRRIAAVFTTQIVDDIPATLRHPEERIDRTNSELKKPVGLCRK